MFKTKVLSEPRKIILGERELNYVLKRRRGSRQIRLTLNDDGSGLVMTLPFSVSVFTGERFILEKGDWILAQMDKMRASRPLFKAGGPREDYLQHKKAAAIFVSERLARFNELYQFKFNRVTIKNQKSCWGSCSRHNNLNFNYKILLLPSTLADYLIVHELCHLKEFNHSIKFWHLVAQAIPDYKARRALFRSREDVI